MHSRDGTIERKLINHYQFLFTEYELVKNKAHPRYKYVKDLCRAHNINKQSLLKYYGRFKSLGKEDALLPKKRGRKFGDLKTMPFIRNKIAELRDMGFGRYEIFDFLLPKYGKYTPSATTIYNYLKRIGKHKLSPNLTKPKRKIVSKGPGELGNIDLHVLKKGTILEPNNPLQSKKYYLMGCVDSFTRITWVTVCEDATSLTASMEGLKIFSVFHQVYQITFNSILTDNGAEFGSKQTKEESRKKHPFERLLLEKNIRHKYTLPYRPQTNGKIERFWRTLETELIGDKNYSNISEFKEELYQYLITYNHIRRHQGINNITPYQKLESVSE